MEFIVAHWYLFAALAVILYFLFADLIRGKVHGVNSIQPTDAVVLINREGGVVIDINDEQKHKEGHIPGAVNMPLTELAKNPASLDKYKNKPIIVSATNTGQAGTAASLLRKQGHSMVYVLSGGQDAWQQENLPLEH